MTALASNDDYTKDQYEEDLIILYIYIYKLRVFPSGDSVVPESIEYYENLLGRARYMESPEIEYTEFTDIIHHKYASNQNHPLYQLSICFWDLDDDDIGEQYKPGIKSKLMELLNSEGIRDTFNPQSAEFKARIARLTKKINELGYDYEELEDQYLPRKQNQQKVPTMGGGYKNSHKNTNSVYKKQKKQSKKQHKKNNKSSRRAKTNNKLRKSGTNHIKRR